MESRNQKTLCCLCCESGPIEAYFKLPKTGYVPGEFALLQGHVRNGSTSVMDSSKVELIQTTRWHATTKSRNTTRVVATTSKGPIQGHGSETWEDYMQIPPLPPSSLVGCNIIDVEYSLKLVVDPSGPSFDLEVPLNILIGTIPLQNYFINYQAGGVPPPVSGMPIQSQPEPSAPAPPPISGATAGPPPPSYAECVFGKNTIREDDDTEYTRGQLDFTPIYTFYGGPPANPSAPPPPYPSGGSAAAPFQQPEKGAPLSGGF